ncbi:MAG: hypothetical protein AAF698_08775, partial [Pseudomonadota bacterium]
MRFVHHRHCAGHPNEEMCERARIGKIRDHERPRTLLRDKEVARANAPSNTAPPLDDAGLLFGSDVVEMAGDRFP